MRVIRAVQFEEDSTSITFMEDTDVRLAGKAFLTKTLTVAGDQHEDEVRELVEQIQDLVRDILEDFANSLPLDFEEALRGNAR